MSPPLTISALGTGKGMPDDMDEGEGVHPCECVTAISALGINKGAVLAMLPSLMS